mmetsp:Transcript_91070/g.260574  ORF Transcript_91070/g.260574 Transcript_91070/m.260574 type:complete len:233 (+) Transcript_91070:682-1380(+)
MPRGQVGPDQRLVAASGLPRGHLCQLGRSHRHVPGDVSSQSLRGGLGLAALGPQEAQQARFQSLARHQEAAHCLDVLCAELRLQRGHPGQVAAAQLSADVWARAFRLAVAQFVVRGVGRLGRGATTIRAASLGPVPRARRRRIRNGGRHGRHLVGVAAGRGLRRLRRRHLRRRNRRRSLRRRRCCRRWLRAPEQHRIGQDGELADMVALDPKLVVGAANAESARRPPSQGHC